MYIGTDEDPDFLSDVKRMLAQNFHTIKERWLGNRYTVCSAACSVPDRNLHVLTQ